MTNTNKPAFAAPPPGVALFAAAVLMISRVDGINAATIPQDTNSKTSATAQTSQLPTLSRPAVVPDKIGALPIPQDSDLSRMLEGVAKSGIPTTNPRDHSR